jgi:hypothetical protein
VSLALPEALFFTGIDWAAETHAACVMDAAGKIAAGFTIERSAGRDRAAGPPPPASGGCRRRQRSSASPAGTQRRRVDTPTPISAALAT